MRCIAAGSALIVGALIVAFLRVGAQSPNLAVSVRYAIPAQVTLGEPVVLELSAHNEGKEATVVDLGLADSDNSHVSIRQPDGKTMNVGFVLPDRADEAREYGIHPLGPGQTYKAELILSEFSDFSTIGPYRVRAEFSGVAGQRGDKQIDVTYSWKGEVAVLARNAGALRTHCERLLQEILSTDDLQLRVKAVKRLRSIQDPVVVQYLSQVLEHAPADTRSISLLGIEGLQRFETLQARAALTAALGHQDPFIAATAKAAIERLDRKQLR